MKIEEIYIIFETDFRNCSKFFVRSKREDLSPSAQNEFFFVIFHELSLCGVLLMRKVCELQKSGCLKG